jgi:hypothetical protein
MSDFDPRTLLNAIRIIGAVVKRDESVVVIHSGKYLFEILSSDVLHQKEASGNQHELVLHSNANIIMQSVIDPKQAAYVSEGKGVIGFINRFDNCTECSACTDCGTDCSRCTDCTECSRELVDLGTGIGQLARRFLTPLTAPVAQTPATVMQVRDSDIRAR